MAENPEWMMALTTVLGADVMLPMSFTAEESLSAPFEVTVEAGSTQANIDPNSLLFTNATLAVQRNNGGTRYFNGKVRAITTTSQRIRDLYIYKISIVPAVWFLDQTEDCRVFQNMTISAIIASVCNDGQVTISDKTTGAKDVRPYVTQYNESNLHFIARLMEQAGYFYFFDHTSASHTMVILDSNTSLPGSPKPTLTVINQGHNEDILTSWQPMPATAWGKVEVTDYDPTKAASPPDSSVNTVLKAPGAASRAVMRWPALGLLAGEVSDRANFMIQAAEADAQLISCDGFDVSLAAGSKFTLLLNPVSGAKNVDYFVRRIVHAGSDGTYSASGGAASYSNTMLVLPVAVPFRPKMITPRPVMAGIYGGIVIGQSGEEIDTGQDALGCVKVRMFFDHKKTADPSQDPWVRVMHPWAGNSWGYQLLPRVGTEVAIGFMDGDPDRPVVIGGLYNSTMSPIFPLPAQKNKTGWRTRSTKQGGTSNFSEFSIDDTKGSELVFFHAEKDYTKEVENNELVTIGNDRTVEIQKGNDTLTVDQGNRVVTVSQGNDTHTVKTGNREVTVTTGNDTHTVKTGNREVKVSTGNDTHTVSMGNREATVSMGNEKLTVDMGNITIEASLGKVSIKAMQGIELTVGANSIKIDPSGISIEGAMVQAKGDSMVSVGGAIVQVKADGMLMLKGGISMIN